MLPLAISYRNSFYTNRPVIRGLVFDREVHRLLALVAERRLSLLKKG